MSDCCWTQIEIGGNVDYNLKAKLLQNLELEDLIDPGEDNFENFKNEERIVQFEVDDGEGRFATLERFLRENNIAYDRYCANDGEYSAERSRFRPRRGLVDLCLDYNGDGFLTLPQLEQLDNNGNLNINYIKDIMGENFPNLEPFEFVNMKPIAAVVSAVDLKVLNSDGRTECAQCSKPLKQPYPGISYCPDCEP